MATSASATEPVREVPPYSEWPTRLKQFLIAKAIERFFAPFPTKQYAWRRLLCSHYAGTIRDGKIWPHSVEAEDVYEIALAESDAWHEAGRRMEFL